MDISLWGVNEISNVFIQEDANKNAISKMVAICPTYFDEVLMKFQTASSF